MADTPKTHDEAVRKIAELIKDVQFAMLTTETDEGALHSRPMATQQAPFNGELWFLTSWKTHKVDDIQHQHRVNVAYSDPANDKYVSIAGTAEVLRDQSKIDELWNPLFKAWFPKGKNDPEIAAIRVHVESAEYWDTPENKMVQVIGFAKAALTGKPYHPGENAAVDFGPSDVRKDPAA